jgi:hypothetical protein
MAMTKDELLLMVNSTINTNGKRQITGKDLNLALNAIVDSMGTSTGGDSEEGIPRNDVNFFDYDGTLLYSYTWDEAKNLESLPELPTHSGMEVREWNYTLEDIKAQGTETTIGKADIGACCYDTDGNFIEHPNALIIERGGEVRKSKQYSILRVVSYPNTVTSLNQDRLNYTYVIGELKIPASVESIAAGYSYSYGSHISAFHINGKTEFELGNIFGGNYLIGVFSYPSYVSSDCYFANALAGAYLVKYSKNIQKIYPQSGPAVWDLSDCEQIPILQSIWSLPSKIIIPDELYDEWITATNWVDVTDRLMKKSDYYGEIKFEELC